MAKTNSRTEASVQNGIIILEAAIASGLSLSEASRQYDFGRNYVSDVKARLENNMETKKVSRKSYREFKRTLKSYNKSL